MVGLVIVSHSARLAEGVAELARGMGGPDVPLRATGGLDLPDRPLGTDASLVLKAIDEVYSDDGVVVLMDLGSAVLSAEMALDMLPREQRAHVVLCEAPLVEGAVAAAVQARLGSPLAVVIAEARGALAAKASHLGTTDTPLEEERAATAAEAGRAAQRELRLTVRNRLGLHARPAARFVQTAGRYPGADVRLRDLTSGRGPVSAMSINSVGTLGVRQGHEILLMASGPDAQAALEALRTLADEGFGDPETAAGPPALPAAQVEPRSTPPGRGPFLQGLAVSPGIAIGPARLFHAGLPAIPSHTVADPQGEWDRLRMALEKTRSQIQATHDAIARRADDYTAAIFAAHLLFLDDEALIAPARAAIMDEKLNAGAAWQQAVEQVAASYRALDDDYLAGRAADVEDVGRQVLRNLPGGTEDAPRLAGLGILIATDLTPAEVARLDPAVVLGICTAAGGPTSHSAILARAFGIPAVAGLGDAIIDLAEGTPVIVDGGAGQVWPAPPPAVSADYARRAEAHRVARAEARSASAAPAVTRDGRRVEIAANIGSVADARAAVGWGAESVGLFRTEFLFLDRRVAPDEDEQCAAYRAVAEALGGRPLIVRTLDAGGDKPLPYLDVEAEANPYLGWRAIRLCLAQPDFFKTQLRAILRVAAEFPVKVMFPMIATLAEWRAGRALLDEARSELLNRGESVPDKVETGIMVEVPAAAVRARQFAAEVDFFSIGTNDLAQYTLAAERGNPRLAALSDAFQPAVIELIRQVVEAAHTHGKWAGVCGEMAGDPLAVPLLVGLGIDELSMNAPAIPCVKQIIRTLDYASVRALAQDTLALETPEAIRAAVVAASVVPLSRSDD
jgi:phosphoenolpyruvate-protein phosphotransferase/dihydroxyacetone kinase phosphotransfer subunit